MSRSLLLLLQFRESNPDGQPGYAAEQVQNSRMTDRVTLLEPQTTPKDSTTTATLPTELVLQNVSVDIHI